jgi:hypothetical protein
MRSLKLRSGTDPGETDAAERCGLQGTIALITVVREVAIHEGMCYLPSVRSVSRCP